MLAIEPEDDIPLELWSLLALPLLWVFMPLDSVVELEEGGGANWLDEPVVSVAEPLAALGLVDPLLDPVFMDDEPVPVEEPLFIDPELPLEPLGLVPLELPDVPVAPVDMMSMVVAFTVLPAPE